MVLSVGKRANRRRGETAPSPGAQELPGTLAAHHVIFWKLSHQESFTLNRQLIPITSQGGRPCIARRPLVVSSLQSCCPRSSPSWCCSTPARRRRARAR